MDGQTPREQVIEVFMLEQIQQGHITSYLTDLLLDFRLLRENGLGMYFWGVRGNGCGTDLIVCNTLTKGLRDWRKAIPTGVQKTHYDYPLSWAWAYVNDSGVSMATAYKIVVKEISEDRHFGTVEPVTKADIRNYLQTLEESHEIARALSV